MQLTGRKLADRDLALVNDRLRLAMESSKSVGWDWDVKSGRNTWFGDLRGIFGIPSETYSGRVEDFHRRIHPDDRERVGKAVKDAMNTHGPYAAEFRILRPDGTVCWVAAKGSFYYLPEGEPERMLGIAVDVTERKRTEEGLRLKEMELSEAQRLAQIGSWEWDPDTDTVNWSRELYRITGRDPKLPAVSYKEHSLILTAESWERLQRSVEEALRSGTPYELDLEYVRPDGSTIWARARGEAQRDVTGRVVRLRGTAQDINKRRLAERELTLANERLRLAMEAAKAVGWDRDVKTGRDTLFGDLQSIFGIPSEVYDGRVEDFYRYLHPNDRGRILEAINDAMERKKPYAAEFRILRPDSAVRWIAARGKFCYSPEGEPERMLGMAVDVTERKLREKNLRESEERLRLAAQAGK